jgi:NAD(P) transhydrogenase subunit alpha
MTETSRPSGAPEDEPSPPTGSPRPMVVGVRKEPSPGERRVALVPDDVGRLLAAGLTVLVEHGAGDGAWLTNGAYVDAGAAVGSAEEVVAGADVLVMVDRPTPSEVATLAPNQTVIGMLGPLTDPDLARSLAERGVTAMSLDGIPRTLSRAQSMDALTSQANIAGYKAALVAADTFTRFFPLLITASGTFRPADVLVLGAGVAGLQAMGTVRRLGAVVTGYDIRPETRSEIESVGAKSLELAAGVSASGEGGYARSLTPAEQSAQQEELNGHIARRDVVIATAQVPGRRPPLLVTEAAVEQMRAGSVIVDVAASPLGGNVAGSIDGESVVTANGVTIVGAGNLPSEVSGAASAAFSRNISSLLVYLLRDGALLTDTDDEVLAGILVTRGGAVVNKATAELLAARASTGGNP